MSRVLRCNTAIVSVDSEVILRTNGAPSPSLLHFSLDCTCRSSEYRLAPSSTRPILSNRPRVSSASAATITQGAPCNRNE